MDISISEDSVEENIPTLNKENESGEEEFNDVDETPD